MMAFQPHRTPPYPNWRFRKLTGRPQLLGVPMAWRRRRQAMAMALGAKKVALGPGPPGPGPAPVQVRATFFAPGATWLRYHQ